jgi:uncharacterized SAM-binding protein YcdF (DUF218 family)
MMIRRSRPGRILRRFSLAVSAACLALLLTWAAGFAWFVHRTGRPGHMPPPADGIVALTGGADRVQAAVHLLKLGLGKKLLISGVAHGTELGDLARKNGFSAGKLADRITLGHVATTTHGNAMETHDWALTNDIHSLIVVTAGYHMPRALTELGRALPGVTLYPAPVLPPAMRGTPDRSTLRLLAGEYTKWLAAEIGLSEFGQGAPKA